MTTWGPWEVYATGVPFQGVPGGGDLPRPAGFVGFQLDPPSPTGQHGVAGNGPFYSPLDETFGVYQPEDAPWPSPTLVESPGAAVQINAQALTVDTCRAGDEPGGGGTTYDVPFTTTPEGDHLSGMSMTDPVDWRVYVYTITGTAQLLQRQQIPDAVLPPPTPVTPPTTLPPPTNLPPEVIGRIILEKANPGFTCELLRWQIPADLVTVFLGQKVSLTCEGVLGRLGFHNRGHVITRIRIRWRADANPVPQTTLEVTATLEKIPGTILPGAGTSTAAQDAAGTGGELALYARWETSGAGWEAGWAA